MILQKTGDLGVDRHLFLMKLGQMNLSESFSRTMLQSWRTVFKVEREVDEPGNWVPEEPLFLTPVTQTRLLSSVSVSAWNCKAGAPLE